MSYWDDRIRNHRLWAEMSNLGTALDNALNRANGAEQATVAIERIRAVLAYIGKRAAAADPLLTSVQTLEAIANGLVNTRTELQNYTANGNAAHLTNANNPTDVALSSAATLPVTETPEELGELVSASISYRAQIEDASASARNAYQQAVADATSFQQRIDAVKNSLEAEIEKINRLSSDYQSQFSTSQESRNNEFASIMRTAQQDILRVQNDYQAQFTAAQDKRTQEFATQSDNLKELTASMISNVQTDLAALEHAFKESAEKAIEDISEKQRHVEKLVGVIGNLGVTSGYLRAANSAKWAMWLWQFLTVSSLVTLTILAYKTLALIEDNKGAMNWIGFAARVLLLVSVGVLAAYSAFQADKLFADEKRNRKLALELEAIGPYLAPLPVEDQNKFRLQVGSRSFGRDIENVIHKHKKSPVSVVDLIKSKEGKEVLEVLVDLVKKAK